MRTARTIAAIIATLIVTAGTTAILLVLLTGLATGLLVSAAAVAAVVLAYRLVLRPWHSRWGTLDGEADAPLPGDDLLPHGAQTTRAIAIDARSEDVWPWLLQLGWGRGGWYSYDWIDNDRRPSAVTLHPDLQQLVVGDTIAMTPEMGFTVRRIEPGATIVSQAPDGTTWCLHLRDGTDGTCRLLSRFRAPRPVHGIDARIWALLADPGTFIMERRMLRGIRGRAGDRRRAVVRVTR